MRPNFIDQLLLCILFSLAVRAATVPKTDSALACEPYVVQDLEFSNPNDIVYLEANGAGPNGSIYYEFYADAQPHWTVGKVPEITKATRYNVRTCNSTSLGLKSSLNIDTNEYVITYTYQDWVHIINPATGHCLTWPTPGEASTYLTFTPCDGKPKGYGQLWSAGYDVAYQLGHGGDPNYDLYYGEVALNPIASKTDSWIFNLNDDNRTIGIVNSKHNDSVIPLEAQFLPYS